MELNLYPLLEPLTIIGTDITQGRTPLVPNWAQRRVIDDMHEQLRKYGRVRQITLKARQLGISTITEAVAFSMAQMVRNYRVFVMAHKTGASQNILNMTKGYWYNHPVFPKLYTLRYASKNHLEWTDIDSSMQVATAGGSDEGRSHTLHFLHASEVAFWPDPYTTMEGLNSTLHPRPLTFVMLESTANGVGNYFEETWKGSVAGDTEYTPLFFPWYEHPEYTASFIRLPYKPLGKLDTEEEVLRRMGIDDDRLMWRRYMVSKFNGKVDQFHQEYPTTPDEAFLSTGSNVFAKDAIYKHYFPTNEYAKGHIVLGPSGPKFVPASNGPLTIYKLPNKDTRLCDYVIGVDPTRTLKGDPAVMQVINRRTLEQVAVYEKKIGPTEMGQDVAALGYFYNTAALYIEKTGPGYGTIGAVMGMNYPRIGKARQLDKTQGIPKDLYGLATTKSTKAFYVGTLQEYINDDINPLSQVGLRLHNPQTVNQLENYISLPTDVRGGFGPADEASGGHDDHVSALFLALVGHDEEPPMQPYHKHDPANMPDIRQRLEVLSA